MMTRYVLVFLLSVFATLNSSSQEQKLQYSQHLTISDGLAHSGITSIIQDSRDYIWIGTYDGLNRYDGYNFKLFKNTLENDFFHSNRIRALLEDHNGNIWIGSDEGLSVYEYNRNRFIKFPILPEHSGSIIRKIIEIPAKNLVVCATEGAGVHIYNLNYEREGVYNPVLSDSTAQEITFYDAVVLDASSLLFISSAGLLSFDINNGAFTEGIIESLPAGTGAAKVNDSTILVSHFEGISIIKYHKTSWGFDFDLLGRQLESLSINSLSIDKYDKLWLGSQYEGIIRIEDLSAFLESGAYSYSVFRRSTDILRVSCISTFTSSGCWVGTFNKGLFRFNFEKNPFRIYNTDMGLDGGLSSNHILNICNVDEHRVYVTALWGGTALYDTRTESFDPLPFTIPMSHEQNTWITFIDSREDTWIMFGGNLWLRRVKKGQSYPVPFEDDVVEQLASVSARTIAEDNNGNIWLGSVNGLYKLNLDASGNLTHVESINDHPFFRDNELTMVRQLYSDPYYDYLWVGTNNEGLIRIDTDGDTALESTNIQTYTSSKSDTASISSNFITSILRLPDSTLWIGTEQGGICSAEELNDRYVFRSYTERDGLSNNVVKALIHGSDNNLWISTNIGLNKFDPHTKEFQVFGDKDGLPFVEFYYGAAQLPNGMIMFSGPDGFLYFDPEEVSKIEEVPGLHISDFRLFNSTVLPGDKLNGRRILEKNIDLQDEIKLRHNENVFSLALNSLHFSNPENHFLRYRLNPVHKEWIEIPSSQGNVTFSGLRPGKYELYMMSSNAMKQWNEPRKLSIIIRPPWYAAKIAILGYVILIILLGYLIIAVILRFQNLQHKLEIEQLEKENVKEVNAAKLRFFSNISHEIKTPLTLLTGPVRFIQERFASDAELTEKVQVMKRQAKKISQLITQVHDFQRADANMLRMNTNHFVFNTFIAGIVKEFEYYAESEKKQLLIRENKEDIYVTADREKLEKILYNVLSNAFKFTSQGDKIELEFQSEDDELAITVRDTGKGIEASDLPHIFERFYKAKDSKDQYSSGSGIGLAFSKRLVEMHYGYITAESKIHEGTSIHIKLPVVTKDPVDDQDRIEEVVLSSEKECLSDDLFISDPADSDLRIQEEFIGKHIYLTEDNPDMREYMHEFLSKYFKVTSFENGKACKDALEEEWPDLILSDVLMPEMNGFELCRTIKTDIRTSHIPIILITACNTMDDQIQGLTEGADAYIFKPFHPKHLLVNIETLLQNRQKLQVRFQKSLPLTLEKGKLTRNDRVFLEKLYALMEQNLDNYKLELDSFTRELYLNRTHFYQKVKALTDQTPYELLKSFRLEKAARLLLEEDVSVNEVYIRTGFKNRPHFSRLFKDRYHVSPGKYRLEVEKNLENDSN